MKELRKVNSMQLYSLWRNLAIALLCMGGTIAVTHMLPYYMAPVVGLLACGVLYTMLWNGRDSRSRQELAVALIMLYALLIYTFTSVGLVLVFIFHLFPVPNELIFFNEPYMPSLILLPAVLVSSLFVVINRKLFHRKKRLATRFRLGERGYFALLSAREISLQLSNITVVFALLTGITWWYFLKLYVDVDLNGRDWYVFVWIVILVILIDEVYFMARYYNLYLDLLEHDEIITPEQLRDITAKTYLRCYAICGEYIYVTRYAEDRLYQKKGVVDTPLVTKRNVNGVPTTEVRSIVEKMTGLKNGELRFYYGRNLEGVDKHSVLRYFYFLDGTPEDYPELEVKGEWMHFNDLKSIYASDPGRINSTAVNDISRLATIILTERVFDEEGNRKNKIRSYQQHLRLADVRSSHLDFQDDKWIRIANFNSDARFFRVQSFLRGLFGRKNERTVER